MFTYFDFLRQLLETLWIIVNRKKIQSKGPTIPGTNEIKRSIISWQIKPGINEINYLSFTGNSNQTCDKNADTET